MKRVGYLLLLLIGTIVSTNMHVQAKSHKKATFKQIRENVKSMWFCLHNQNKCSKQEVAKAKRWCIKTPTKIIVATLSAIGIVVTAYSVNKQQQGITKENENDNPQYRNLNHQQRLALRSTNEGISKKVNLNCKNIIDILQYSFTEKESALNAFRQQYGTNHAKKLKDLIENCKKQKWHNP